MQHATGVISAYRNPVRGYHFFHIAIDGHSAYSELLCDERKETATAFWKRANACFNDYGIKVRTVLTDNGSCFPRAILGRTEPAPKPHRKQRKELLPRRFGPIRLTVSPGRG